MSSQRHGRLVDGSVPPLNVNARPGRLVGHFRSLLDAHPVTALDVGARGGIPGELEALKPYLNLVAMEPEPAEARRLEAHYRELGLRSVTVLPDAAGPEGGRYTLHITRDPGRSSLYEPNPAVARRYNEGTHYEVASTVSMTTTPLATLLERHAVGPLDLLKLDVQGFELEVLRTLAAAQWDRLLMIQSEVEFVELYKGQPLFRHVDEEVSRHGFELFHLSRVFTNYGRGRWVPYGRGQIQFGDAFYLRTALDGLPDDAVVRLAFLAAYYGFTDYAHHVFREREAAFRALGGAHHAAFESWFRSFAAEGRGLGAAFAGQGRRVLNKLLYVLLTWRRWNGRDGDNDLYYPVR